MAVPGLRKAQPGSNKVNTKGTYKHALHDLN